MQGGCRLELTRHDIQAIEVGHGMQTTKTGKVVDKVDYKTLILARPKTQSTADLSEAVSVVVAQARDRLTICISRFADSVGRTSRMQSIWRRWSSSKIDCARLSASRSARPSPQSRSRLATSRSADARTRSATDAHNSPAPESLPS